MKRRWCKETLGQLHVSQHLYHGHARRRRESQETGSLFEKIMKENSPNVVKEIGIQVERVPNKMNPKRSTTRYLIIKMSKVKDKERILKAAREKQWVTYKGPPIRLSADFSTQTLQARRTRTKYLK